MTPVIINLAAGAFTGGLPKETKMKTDANLTFLACSLLGLAAALLFYGASLT